MERLQVGRARIVVLTIDVIHFDLVVLLEAQPTIPTTPVLPFEQLGQSQTDTWVPSSSGTPVHPIAIIGTAMALDLDMPGNGHLLMGMEVDGVRPSRWGGEGATGVEPVPVSLNGPPDGLGRVSSVCPAAELHPREVIEPRIDSLTHADAVIVCPPPDLGVELTDPLALGQGLGAANDPSELRQMRLDIGLRRFDQGLEPQAVA